MIQHGTTHAVGSLNSRSVRTLPEVKANANIDNFTLAELSHDANGVRLAVPLSDKTKESVLIASVETMYDMVNDNITEFFNGAGEFVRAVVLEKGLRFETSAFVQISGTAPANGQFGAWDATAKKFQLSATVDATAMNTFRVVDVNELDYTLGAKCVRLEVIK